MEYLLKEIIWSHPYSKTAICCSITTFVLLFWWKIYRKKNHETCMDTDGSPEVGNKTTGSTQVVAIPYPHITPYSFSNQLLKEIYETSSKSDEIHYANRCIQLVQAYPGYINIPCNDNECTPFLVACSAGSVAVVSHMLTYGANIASRTFLGESAFYLAAYSVIKRLQKWDPTIITLLYDAGCDVLAPTRYGLNTLHLAASFGHFPLTRWLLLHGADPEEATLYGVKPMHLALQLGHTELAELLRLEIGEDDSEEERSVYSSNISRRTTSTPRRHCY